VGRAEGVNGVWENIKTGRVDHPDPETTVQGIARGMEIGAEFVGGIQDLACEGNCLPAFSGEHPASADCFEELDTQTPFQFVHRLRQSRLADSKAISRIGPFD